MKKANKSSSYAVPLLIFLVGTIALFLMRLARPANQMPTSSPTPSAEASGSTKKYSSIENYISASSCEAVTENWKTARVSDVVTLKIPGYIRQYSEYNGQNFEINHPSLGRLLITTSLVGGFKIKEASGFDESFDWLIHSRAEHLNQASFYLSNNMQYVIGDYFFLIADDVEPPQWWMFSVIEQDVTQTGTQETEYTKTDDFKCLLRSVSFEQKMVGQ